jgi:hypothetical protein
MRTEKRTAKVKIQAHRSHEARERTRRIADMAGILATHASLALELTGANGTHEWGALLDHGWQLARVASKNDRAYAELSGICQAMNVVADAVLFATTGEVGE